MSTIAAIRMPKWGLSMEEGKIVRWWKSPGDRLAGGEDLVDIETSKITNTAEAPGPGVLRRIVAATDEVLPVGALLAVMADAAATDAEIDRFIDAHRSPPASGEGTAEAPAALVERVVEAAGRRLRVAASPGAGPPIVLLHGFAGDLGNWLFNLDALRAAGPVIAIDLPGHGESSKDVGDGALTGLAAAVGAALDALEVSSAHLVGHSLGAAVAARLAADRPELARSLILIAPAGLFGTQVSTAFLDGVIAAERPRELRPVLEQLVLDPATVTREMVEGVIRTKRLDGVTEAWRTLRDRMAGGADFAALATQAADLPRGLVIAAPGDRVVGAPDPAALPPGWRLEWVEAAGHLPHLERPGEVNRLILEAVGSREEPSCR